jgi:hypothetical protein
MATAAKIRSITLGPIERKLAKYAAKATRLMLRWVIRRRSRVAYILLAVWPTSLGLAFMIWIAVTGAPRNDTPLWMFRVLKSLGALYLAVVFYGQFENALYSWERFTRWRGGRNRSAGPTPLLH